MSYDPFIRSNAEWFQRWIDYMQHYSKSQQTEWQELFAIGQIFQDWTQHLKVEPQRLLELQANFFQDANRFLEHFQKKINGQIQDNFIDPLTSDRRFSDPDWGNNPFFYFYQQLYLIFVKHCQDFIKNNTLDDEKLRRQVSFFSQQALDAMSPSNFPFTNPQVLKQTLQTHGENLIKGYQKYLSDITRGHGHWAIQMTDMTAFQIGKDIAATPGKVVFQNELIQLIQYTPTTETVHEVPFLMVPPWINKYYILDLRERNSYVKWIVEKGYTVFMISWVNPDESYRNTSFEDYIFEGVMAALDAVTAITKQKQANLLGFCIGGTLLSVALAYMQKINDHRVKSATFLTTLIDFSEPGDIEVFIDERQISALETRMNWEGFLDGRLMMMTFNFLRSNDLYWSFFINNYLCGKDPFPFDLLYWNCDSTNLPAKMHSEYLRKFYLENRFVDGLFRVNNVTVSPQDIIIPCFFLSAEQDHIAPWASTFSGAQCLNGEVEFVLGMSGHIAGVVNPPLSEKYSFKTNGAPIVSFQNAKSWNESATSHPGSWWGYWEKWLSERSGAQGSPPSMGNAQYHPIQDAPGDYVKRRLDDL